MSKSRKSFLALAVILAFLGAHAESTPDALDWLDKMSEAARRGPISVDLNGEVAVNQMGQQVAATMSGSMTRKDRKHLRLDMTVKMNVSGMEMEMAMLSVGDGTTLWTEMTNPTLGAKQVMKIDLDRMEALREAGGPMAANVGGADPLGDIQSMTEKFDFKVQSSGDGLVTLVGTPKPEMLDELEKEFPGASDNVSELRLVLDADTQLPLEMRMGGEDPVMSMRFENYERLDAASIAADTFSYTPPEGVQVMDIGAMAAGATEE